MKRIESLTVEQQALLHTQREHWLATGLSTERADRAEAERGVRLAYEAAKLTPPPFILWVDSPLAGAWAQALAPEIIAAAVNALPAGVRPRSGPAQVGDQVRDQVGDQVWDQVWDQVRDQVRDQVGDQVRDQVGDQVWDQVWDQVRDQVWDQVGAQVRDQVWDQVAAQVWDQVASATRDRLNNWTAGLDGYYGSYWTSWIDTMAKLGVQHLEPWEGQQALAGSAFWWWTFAGFAVICERPTVLRRDPQRRLHAEDGFAIQWPDGWGFHVWHGTRVPADLVEKGWSVEQILREENAEIRRCAIERMGWPEFIAAAKLSRVGSVAADPGNPGYELGLYDLPGQVFGAPIRILLCTNATTERDGTRRRFGLTVPADVLTPVGAAAWTFGLSEAEYEQLAAAC